MAFSILCPAQQRVPEVSCQPFQTVATPPDCISHTVCLRQKGKDSCPSKWLPAALWLFLILGTRVAFLELLISFIIFPPRDFRVHWPVSSAISTLLQCLCPPLLQIHYICTTPLSYMWDAHRDAFCSQVNILSTSYLTALWCLAFFSLPVTSEGTDVPAFSDNNQILQVLCSAASHRPTSTWSRVRFCPPRPHHGAGCCVQAQVTPLEQDRSSYMI